MTKTGTEDWNDIDFTCVWEVYEHYMEVIVAEGDTHGDIIMTGYVKWDGCANLKVEDKWLHFCGREEAARYATLFDRIYDLAELHLPNFYK